MKIYLRFLCICVCFCIIASTKIVWAQQIPKELLRQANVTQADMRVDIAIAKMLIQEGKDCQYKGSPQVALRCFDTALKTLSKDNSDSETRKTRVAALLGMGLSYEILGETAHAFDYNGRALGISQKFKDSEGTGLAQINLAMGYNDVGQFNRALSLYNSSLPLLEHSNPAYMVQALSGIGMVYMNINRPREAANKFRQARSLLKNRPESVLLLLPQGLSELEGGDAHAALSTFDKALPFLASNPRARALVYIGKGKAYFKLKDWEKAETLFGWALETQHRIHDVRSEAVTLNDLGALYASAGNYEQAINKYNLALPLRIQADDKVGEAVTLGSLAWLWQSLPPSKRHNNLAILYGKQSVSLFQAILSNAQKIDNKSLLSMTKVFDGAYQALAAVLLREGRKTEALEVMDLRKQKELFDYIGKGAKTAYILHEQPSYTSDEKQYISQYAQISNRIRRPKVQSNGQVGDLGATVFGMSEQSYAQIESDNAELTRFLGKLPKYIKRLAPTVAVGIADEKARKFQASLGKLDQTVALYYLCTPSDLYVTLVTQDAITIKQVHVSETELGSSIQRFRRAVSNPLTPPLTSAASLYKLIFKSIEPFLPKEGVKTILWSPDGALSSIPLEALSADGQHYLVERYAVCRLTLGAKKRLLQPIHPVTKALVVAAGEGKGGVPLLPAARYEADSVYAILPGKELPDIKFTKANFFASLSRGWSVVHIASHFEISSDSGSSYLVLGDGNRLSLSSLLEFRSNIFAGCELVTLSACSTGVGEDEGAGVDIDSFAKVVELLGAKSVIASLWTASDASTAKLMKSFYQIWKANPQQGKAQALRQAQLIILSGKKPTVPSSGIKSLSGDLDIPDYSHPYYWATFTLLGNPS